MEYTDDNDDDYAGGPSFNLADIRQKPHLCKNGIQRDHQQTEGL